MSSVSRILRGCILLSGLLAANISVADSNTITQLWETNNTDLKSPESVIYDKKRDQFYVSNVNGGPLEKKENGFISIMSREGKITQKIWFSESLWAPKGLAIVGDHLFVADISKVVEIDLESAGLVKTYVAEDAQFLNDVVADKNGDVYISDMLTHTIYRIRDGEMQAWVSDPRLASPNGLSLIDDQLVVASWGIMDGEGFETSVAGHLLNIPLSNAAISDRFSTQPLGNLDGLERTSKGQLLITDWLSGKLLRIDSVGEVTQLLDLDQGSADLGYIAEEGLVLIPMMLNNTVQAYHFKE